MYAAQYIKVGKRSIMGCVRQCLSTDNGYNEQQTVQCRDFSCLTFHAM